ncbi:MAG: hypothetical protein K8J08_14950 [Thermoanaerobaculia bacterium]|nr:hypothetical protein [Thermoanaerobaculia bacterium]
MNKLMTYALVGGMILTGVGLAGCGKGGEETAAAANQEAWAWLEKTNGELDALRDELAAARREAHEAPVVTEGEPTDETTDASMDEGTEAAVPATESAADRVAALETKIGDLSSEFGAKLVEYINSLEMFEGEPLTPEQQKALRMKSDEDIEVAEEYIEKGGDYKRALDIYNALLLLDADYPRLNEAIARAEEMRYPTEERFAEVKKGMTPLEVRDILGPVNLHNVREYPREPGDKGYVEGEKAYRVAWFYPKDPAVGRSPSGVYFQMGEGAYKVYQTDYGSDEEAEPDKK